MNFGVNKVCISLDLQILLQVGGFINPGNYTNLSICCIIHMLQTGPIAFSRILD